MPENSDNPLDDELLKELGLAPTGSAPKGLPPGTNSAPPSGTAARPSQDGAQRSSPLVGSPPPAAKGGGFPPRRPGAPEMKAPPPPQGSATRAPARASAAPPQSDEQFQQGLSHLSEDMPVQVVAVLGKRTMTLKDVIALKQGEIIELKKLPQETIDLVANGKLMARGELVLVDGKLGIQIKQLVG